MRVFGTGWRSRARNDALCWKGEAEAIWSDKNAEACKMPEDQNRPGRLEESAGGRAATTSREDTRQFGEYLPGVRRALGWEVMTRRA